jgi:predicted TPR repeat methyltransferase
MKEDAMKADGEDAACYDQQAIEHGWHGHEALFGMMYELVEPGEMLLDIGIGTGLGSILFHRAGLMVSGFDSSREMLQACETKGFVANLERHDLRKVPYPYPAGSFNHVISIGVLNFFADLKPVFAETSRIIKPDGIFGFTVEEQKTGQESEYTLWTGDESGRANHPAAVTMHRHGDAHIRSLLDACGFEPLKDLEFSAGQYPSYGMEIFFKAYIARKT